MKPQRTLVASMILSMLSMAILALMEWLFFATKPSFLTVYSVSQMMGSLFVAASLLAVTGLIAALVISTAASILPARFSEVSRFAQGLVPALALTVTTLLLLDNFSRTIFGFGSEHSQGAVRLLYLLLLVACFWMWLVFSTRWIGKRAKLEFKHLLVFLLVAGIAVFVSPAGSGLGSPSPDGSGPGSTGGQRFNVLVFGGDGISASHLPMYGYERDTAPFLQSLANESVWATNAFSNSAHTGGAIISMLTAKLPIENGVIYPPDILSGNQAYQSLPALLRSRNGYRTFQASYPVWADALDLNLRNAFDLANGRSAIEPASAQLASTFLGEAPLILLRRSATRIGSRLKHIFMVEDAHDAFIEVAGDAGEPVRVSDQVRISDFFDFADRTGGPFFAHIHLMGSHGSTYRPEVRNYSKGQEQTENFMDDFYDDTIADFDRHLENLYEGMEVRGLLENTILVIYSDHGKRHSTIDRLPLLFRVPGREPTIIEENVQSLDIPRSILELLGLDKPDWMGGQSIFSEVLDPCRPILSTAASRQDADEREVYFESLHHLGRLRVIVGSSFYQWGLLKDAVNRYELPGAPPQAACGSWEKDEIRSYFISEMAKYGHVPRG